MGEIVTDAWGKPVDYVFLEVNRAFETQTGLVGAEIVGRRVTDVLPGIEDAPFIETYGKVALTGEPIRFEQYAAPLDRYAFEARLEGRQELSGYLAPMRAQVDRIAERIVREHGGTITAASSPGGGATVNIRLPALAG